MREEGEDGEGERERGRGPLLLLRTWVLPASFQRGIVQPELLSHPWLTCSPVGRRRAL
jgi:hypothetical protein